MFDTLGWFHNCDLLYNFTGPFHHKKYSQIPSRFVNRKECSMMVVNHWWYGELIKGYFCNGDYCVFGDVETGARTSKPSFVNPAKRTKSSVPSKMNPFNKNKKHIETCDQAIQNV